jgi:hypothetical protein|tara:strand:+ start:1041 stop:1664 length:624 start_codon:yes stop_codon:yes gene_type:complete
MDLSKLSEKVPASRVEKRAGKGGTKLDYVTARFCMDRLDQAVGPENWRNEYKEIKGHLICGVSVKCDGEWVTKWDVGTESTFEAEKGNFSDAFKRACVHWGIARELYHESSEAFEGTGGETSVGVSEQVPPVTSDDWENHVLHFSKHAGKTLGSLTEKSLEWFQNTWNPYKHWKSGETMTPSQEDLILLEMLKKSMRKGGTKDGFGG